MICRGSGQLFAFAFNGNPLQYSCLENPMDRGAWWATVHGVGHDWVTSPTFTPHNSILCCDYRWRDFGSGSLNNPTMQGQIASELQLPDLGGWQKVKESEGQHVGFAISTVSRGTHWDLLGCSLKLQFLRPQLKSMKLESPRDGNIGSSF